jgi:hypothetical protein
MLTALVFLPALLCVLGKRKKEDLQVEVLPVPEQKAA